MYFKAPPHSPVVTTGFVEVCGNVAKIVLFFANFFLCLKYLLDELYVCPSNSSILFLKISCE